MSDGQSEGYRDSHPLHEAKPQPVEIPPAEIIERPGSQSNGARPEIRGVRAPVIDIIVLIHDQAKWADLCIRAVEHHTSNPYRLIVVDSASQEEATKALLRDVEARGHTVVHLTENKSFSNGVNVGVELGTSKFVCILNDDAIVTEGWDGAMMQAANEKHTGLVGARSNYASGAQGDPSFTGEPPYLVFVCVAMRREVWDVVGNMDEETFDGFSSEDIDYAWRVKKAGYNLKVANAYVFHAGSRTLAHVNGSAEGISRVNQKYNARLIDKWGADWVNSHQKLKERVLVCSYHAEEWTRVTFLGAFMTLKRSDGVSFEFMNQCRAPIHIARTGVCDYALDNGYDILVQLDDDATFPSDLIRRLLSHQKDVVTALAYQRKPPHWPCVFEIGEDGVMGKPMLGIERTGLRKVGVSGFHCSMIRTSVIKRLREGTKDADGKVVVPGTRKYFGGFQTVTTDIGEDFAMSLNLKKVGIPVYCDTDLIAGHIGSSIVVDEQYVRDYRAKTGQ